MIAEVLIYNVAAVFYLCAACAAVYTHFFGRQDYVIALWLLVLALVMNSIAIHWRWERIGHGPYVDLRETLISSVWGYHVGILVTCLVIRKIRAILVYLLPLLLILVLWSVVAPQDDSPLPVTYDTIWLPLHVILGKLFIGCVVVALGLGLIVLSRHVARRRGSSPASNLLFSQVPADRALDELAFRFMLVAFVFDSMMLIVGALWAQDAWGRYWAWDPLETWSFLTWISIVIYLHLRVTLWISPIVSTSLVTVSFLIAFLTFFGIPFLSDAVHQGAV